MRISGFGDVASGVVLLLASGHGTLQGSLTFVLMSLVGATVFVAGPSIGGESFSMDDVEEESPAATPKPTGTPAPAATPAPTAEEKAAQAQATLSALP